MTQTSYPFDPTVATETQYSKLFREFLDSGVVGSHGGTDLEPYGEGAAMNAKVRSGFGFVRGHAYSNDATVTLTISAAHASLTRYDKIVLQLDPSSDSIVLAVVQGTAGAGQPSLTQSDAAVYELEIGYVQVDPAAVVIAANRVFDTRQYVGNRVGVWTTALQPASPRKGRLGYNVSTGAFEYYTGSAWANVVPTEKRLASGQGTAAFGGGALNKTINVTFPVSRFSAAPTVVTGIEGSAGNTSRCAARVNASPTSSGCAIVVYNEDGDVVTGNIRVNWIAVQEP